MICHFITKSWFWRDEGALSEIIQSKLLWLSDKNHFFFVKIFRYLTQRNASSTQEVPTLMLRKFFSSWKLVLYLLVCRPGMAFWPILPEVTKSMSGLGDVGIKHLIFWVLLSAMLMLGSLSSSRKSLPWTYTWCCVFFITFLFYSCLILIYDSFLRKNGRGHTRSFF